MKEGRKEGRKEERKEGKKRKKFTCLWQPFLNNAIMPDTLTDKCASVIEDGNFCLQFSSRGIFMWTGIGHSFLGDSIVNRNSILYGGWLVV